MAPLPTIANCYRVAFNWVHGPTGQTAANVMHFANAGTTPAEVASDLNAHVAAAMWTPVSGDASVVSLTVTPLDGGGASVNVPVSGDQWDGQPGGDMIPAASCVVSLNTLSRGRSYRGRVFLPFLAEGSQSQGDIGDTTVTDTAAAWETFRSYLEEHGPQLVVASYKLASYAECSSLSVKQGAGTQRRRQERVRYP